MDKQVKVSEVVPAETSEDKKRETPKFIHQSLRSNLGHLMAVKMSTR